MAIRGIPRDPAEGVRKFLNKNIPFKNGLDESFIPKWQSVQNLAMKVVGHPKAGAYVVDIIRGTNPLLQVTKIAKVKDTLLNPFLFALLDFNMALDSKYTSDFGRGLRGPLYVTPVEILKAMRISRDDEEFMCKAYMRTIRNLQANNYLDEVLAKEYSIEAARVEVFVDDMIRARGFNFA